MLSFIAQILGSLMKFIYDSLVNNFKKKNYTTISIHPEDCDGWNWKESHLGYGFEKICEGREQAPFPSRDVCQKKQQKSRRRGNSSGTTQHKQGPVQYGAHQRF